MVGHHMGAMTTRLVALVALLAIAVLVGLLLRRTAGQARTVSDGDRLDAAALGAPALGERATLIQFSTTTCAPCRAARRLLNEIAAETPGVAYVEVDAEERLDLARRLRVLRTPTVLFLDAEGRVVSRSSGAQHRRQVSNVVHQLVNS